MGVSRPKDVRVPQQNARAIRRGQPARQVEINVCVVCELWRGDQRSARASRSCERDKPSGVSCGKQKKGIFPSKVARTHATPSQS